MKIKEKVTQIEMLIVNSIFTVFAITGWWVAFAIDYVKTIAEAIREYREESMAKN